MPKIKGEKRNREVKIRFTEQEWQQLQSRKTKNLAGWLRDLGLGALPIRQVDPELVRQIARIGSNLNQIARHVNTEKKIDSDVLTALKQSHARLNDLIVLHTKS